MGTLKTYRIYREQWFLVEAENKEKAMEEFNNCENELDYLEQEEIQVNEK